MNDPPRLLLARGVPSSARRGLEAIVSTADPPFDVVAATARYRATLAGPTLGAGGTVAKLVLAAALAAGASLPIAGSARDEAAAVKLEGRAFPSAPAPPAVSSRASAFVVPERLHEPPRASPRRRSRPRQTPPPAPTDDALRREMQLLNAARRALAADPSRTLTLVEQGDREFPRGSFAEERAAYRVFALAALGRDTKALARRFLRRYPNGRLNDRVKTAAGLAS